MANKVKSIKAAFEAEGISIREWARARGYKVRTVYAVLHGELKGKRGLAHKIAVDLGLKDQPESPRFNLSDAA